MKVISPKRLMQSVFPTVRNGSIFNASSLDLQFARTKTLDPRVTFTRASSGTYVDSQGVIRTATTNLQRHSEDFTQGLTPNNATLTANQGLAPNGTITADQFLETTANGLHSQEIADHVFIAGAAYTFSCYAKSIGGRNFAPGFPTLFGSARFGFFNLSGGGSVVNTDAGVTASIQAVGDGWYRCSITSTCVTGGGARVGVFIASGTSISYVGDAAKGLLLWGAQLEQSSTVGEYIPTTSTINSAPRFDHNPTTGESLGLLVEEQRTNLALYSESLTTAPNNVTNYTLNSATTANPLGGTTMFKLVANAGQDPAAANNSGFTFGSAVSLANSTVYTQSIFVKAAEFSTVRLRSNATGQIFDFVLGQTPSPSGSITACSSQLFPSGIYRLSWTFTSTTSAPGNRGDHWSIRAASTGDGSSGFFIWGAQLEAGSFPTSYIPTTTATVTRSADVASITGSNFSSWYRQDEGTVFVNASAAVAASILPCYVSFDNGTTSERLQLRRVVSGTNPSYRVVASGQSIDSATKSIGSPAGFNSQILAYASNNYEGACNGVLEGLISIANRPAATQTQIGAGAGNAILNGTIRRLTYWPQRLANNTLQQITQ